MISWEGQLGVQCVCQKRGQKNEFEETRSDPNGQPRQMALCPAARGSKFIGVWQIYLHLRWDHVN